MTADPHPPRDARITFSCGAFVGVVHAEWSDHARRGRVRLMLVDTERTPPLRRPKLPESGADAPCRFGCPTPRRRREQRAMSDGPDAFAPRTVVLCTGELARHDVAPTPTAATDAGEECDSV